MKLVKLIKMSLNETNSKVSIGKYLSYSFFVHNGLKQGDALPPLRFKIALEICIRKIQKKEGLKSNGTHQLLVYAVDVNLLGNNKATNKKKTQALTDARKDVGLEVNTEKTKYMLLSRDQNSGQNHDISVGNRSFENVANFKYLGTTITSQNMVEE